MFKTLDTGVLIGTEMMHDWTTAKKCYRKGMTSLCTSGKQNAASELDQTKTLESKSESLIWKLQNIEYFTAFHPRGLAEMPKKSYKTLTKPWFLISK